MSTLLIPISMFVKSYIHSLPTLMQSVPIYFFGLFFCYKIYVNPNKINQISISYRVLEVYSVVLVSQLLMILYSYTVATRKEITSGLTTGPVNTFVFFANLCLVYALVCLIIETDLDEKSFFKSIVITLIVYLAIVLLPQVLATVSSIPDRWVNLIGRFLEAHHEGRTFYDNGSYVTTLHRVNGLDPEASFFAAKMGIIFVPVVLAILKNKYNVISGKTNDKLYLYWILLVLMMITLFFAKTSTGMLVIVMVVVSLFFVVGKKQRLYLWTALILGILGIIVLYFVSGYVHGLLNQYLFEKSGTDNRLGGTIALFRTFIHYPLFGVGYGYTSNYNFMYVPKWTTHNAEYMYVYMKSKAGYPDLSQMGSILASYGLIAAVPVCIYINNKLRKVKDLKSMLLKKSKSDAKSVFLNTVMDSFIFYLIYLVVLSLFSFNIQDEIYLLMFMFYIRVINNAVANNKTKL